MNLTTLFFFLCSRQQRFKVNGVKSDLGPVVSGVPQGNVLGPLLFSLYIYNIYADIESEIRHFADDCVCYIAVFLFGLVIWVQNGAPFTMPKSIFYSQLLTNNSQFKNCENSTEENHSFLG